MDFAGRTRDRPSVPSVAASSCAVVPCLDEAATIGAVVRGALRHVPVVVVVDDGSRDSTSAAARDAGAIVVRHEVPLGKGAALASGWERAAALDAVWVMMLDGDGQHASEDIPAFFDAVGSTAARLVIGDRMGSAGAMPWVRRATNRWLSARLSALAGVELPDSQCGFRLAHLPTLRGLGLRSVRYEIESEMAVAFARAGHRVASVPVQVRYGSERSKISPLRDSLRWWRWYRSVAR